MEYICYDIGRLLKQASGEFRYEYYLKDHLCNVRTIFSDLNDDDIAEAIQEDHYYPFGMTINGLGYRENLEDNHLYQGKERQFEAIDIDGNGEPDRNFTWYDFEARYYDQQLGRWHVPDPVLQYPSPYIGMGNDPVNGFDPDGRIRREWLPVAIVFTFGVHNGEGELTGIRIEYGWVWVNDEYYGDNDPGAWMPLWLTGGGGRGIGGGGSFHGSRVKNSFQKYMDEQKRKSLDFLEEVKINLELAKMKLTQYVGIIQNINIASSGEGNIEMGYKFGVNKGTLQDFVNYYDGWHIRDIRNDVKSGEGDGIHFVYDKATGKFIDMKHMLVAGQYGNIGGLFKEFLQLFSSPGSAFNWQDLFSNNLGNYFYGQYGFQLMFYPRQATEYINKFLSAPKIFRFSTIPYEF